MTAQMTMMRVLNPTESGYCLLALHLYCALELRGGPREPSGGGCTVMQINGLWELICNDKDEPFQMADHVWLSPSQVIVRRDQHSVGVFSVDPGDRAVWMGDAEAQPVDLLRDTLQACLLHLAGRSASGAVQ